MFHFKAILTLFFINYYCFWQPHIERDMSAATEARAYYVSPNGNDKNEGTRNAAFQSIQRVNSLHLNPGDSILFEGDQRFTGSLKIDSQNSGNQFHPILISSYGHGVASILGGNGSAIIIQKSSWLKINLLALIGSGRKKGNTRDGLLIRNS